MPPDSIKTTPTTPDPDWEAKADTWRQFIGSEIALARKAAGFSQTELGDNAGGLSQKTVSEVERGINSVMDNYLTLCLALDVSFDSITAKAGLLMRARNDADAAGSDPITRQVMLGDLCTIFGVSLEELGVMERAARIFVEDLLLPMATIEPHIFERQFYLSALERWGEKPQHLHSRIESQHRSLRAWVDRVNRKYAPSQKPAAQFTPFDDDDIPF